MKSTIGDFLMEADSKDRKYVSLQTNPPASSFHLIPEIPSKCSSMMLIGAFV